jgi:glutamate/tyrosine decarboxylase-like PLP-dependent enzyme
MKQAVDRPEEISLDPESWDEMRQLGHRMIDDMFLNLQTVRDRPVWKPIPENVRSFFKQSIPLEPEHAEQVYQDFLTYVLPHPLGNIHPRFWGWVIGTGTPFGMLAEMLSAAVNPNVGGFDQVPALVEAQVVDWCKSMLGYPAEANGLLVSGGSMANLVGLTVARDDKAGFDVLKDGLRQSQQRMTVYGSVETHSSILKAVRVLGLGSDSLRKVPVKDDYTIDVQALKAMIASDKAKGDNPFCIVGNAGTVNTGAIDDLTSLADIAQAGNLWFHVDGSFGAFAALSPRLRQHVRGMERADSLTFCLHKWMYVQYEASCILIRNQEAHRRSFSIDGAYLSRAAGGLSTGAAWFSEYGVQLSRGFKALKIWMSLKEHGVRKYARLVEQNVEQARYLVTLIEKSEELELLAPAPLNVVCFRFNNGRLDEHLLNELNQELLVKLQESGVAVPSSTTHHGKFALRVANTNHRSKLEDFEVLVQKVVEIGRSLLANKHDSPSLIGKAVAR